MPQVIGKKTIFFSFQILSVVSYFTPILAQICDQQLRISSQTTEGSKINQRFDGFFKKYFVALKGSFVNDMNRKEHTYLCSF